MSFPCAIVVSLEHKAVYRFPCVHARSRPNLKGHEEMLPLYKYSYIPTPKVSRVREDASDSSADPMNDIEGLKESAVGAVVENLSVGNLKHVTVEGYSEDFPTSYSDNYLIPFGEGKNTQDNNTIVINLTVRVNPQDVGRDTLEGIRSDIVDYKRNEAISQAKQEADKAYEAYEKAMRNLKQAQEK